MDLYLAVKTIHIVSATIVFGTGIGIAFFMFRSAFTDNSHEKFYAARTTVLADCIFTLPAVVIQPASGAWLVWQGNYEWAGLWLVITYVLYAIAGACWFPVVWIQIQLKKMIMQSIKDESPLPARYHRLFRLWFFLGWPAFASLIIIFYLMVAKPL